MDLVTNLKLERQEFLHLFLFKDAIVAAELGFVFSTGSWLQLLGWCFNNLQASLLYSIVLNWETKPGILTIIKMEETNFVYLPLQIL
jgi:hypothetical protein